MLANVLVKEISSHWSVVTNKTAHSKILLLLIQNQANVLQPKKEILTWF